MHLYMYVKCAYQQTFSYVYVRFSCPSLSRHLFGLGNVQPIKIVNALFCFYDRFYVYAFHFLLYMFAFIHRMHVDRFYVYANAEVK